jgi:Mitochondrial carrier protein
MFLGLYKGFKVNVLRAILVNAAELSFYDKAKYFFSHDFPFPISPDNLTNHFLSSCVSGFMAAVFSSPADVIKTRYMNQMGKNGYAGIGECAKSVWKSEGVIAFYKGFLPLYLRIAPWNVVFFVSYEQLKKWGIRNGVSEN